MSSHTIKVPRKAVETLAKKAAKLVDTKAIAEDVLTQIPKPEDGRDGKDLILTDAIKGDVIDSVSMLVPRGKKGRQGDNYILLPSDIDAIASKVRADFKNNPSNARVDLDDLDIEDIVVKSVEAINDRGLFITPERLTTRLLEVRKFIENQPKGRQNAGISGKDMIDEINKILGVDWQTGGGGGDNNIVVNSQAGNYQLVLADNNKVIEHTNGASDFALTIPPNVTAAFVVGSWIEARKTGAGDITITKGAGVTFRGVLGNVNAKINDADGFSVFFEKTATDIWLISGSVKAV